jgi:hypothetical protein
LALDAGNADTANNLAHVLAQQDKLEEALFWSRRAVQIGGPNPSVYQETLREIEGLRRSPGVQGP